MRHIKKNNAQAVVDKRAAIDNLQQHMALTEEQSRTFLDFAKLKQDNADALQEKDTAIEAMKDQHSQAIDAVREQNSRDL